MLASHDQIHDFTVGKSVRFAGDYNHLGQFDYLEQLVIELASESVPASSGWVVGVVSGLPVMIPQGAHHFLVNLPGESQDHAVDLPAVQAGLLISIFALEYAAYTDSGFKREGIAAALILLKYEYLSLIKIWCTAANNRLSESVLDLID